MERVTKYYRLVVLVPKCIPVSVQHATNLSLYLSIHVVFTYSSTL